MRTAAAACLLLALAPAFAGSAALLDFDYRLAADAGLDAADVPDAPDAPAPDAPAPDVACPTGQTRCDGACVDTRTDASHCGRCGNACALGNATAACAAGACVIGACPAGFADCDRAAPNGCEANLGSDPDHCGGCDVACPPRLNASRVCAAGACAFVCRAGFADCDGSVTAGCEVSTTISVSHCGGCGRVCAPPHAAAMCAGGACAVRACQPDFADCDGDPANGCEVNTTTSSASCGACNNACPTGQVCGAGTCMAACVPPSVRCGAGCADPRTDPLHCGSCAVACADRPHATAACADRACGLACEPGFGNCNASLADGCETDLSVHPDHCGRCGNACPVGGANATSMCVGGACRLVCATGFADCDGVATNGCEATLDTASNCGRCSNACAGASSCFAGECCGASGQRCCGGIRGACASMDRCVGGLCP